MHCVKKSLYAFCFFFLRNLDFTINSYPIQINRYRIRIIRRSISSFVEASLAI